MTSRNYLFPPYGEVDTAVRVNAQERVKGEINGGNRSGRKKEDRLRRKHWEWKRVKLKRKLKSKKKRLSNVEKSLHTYTEWHWKLAKGRQRVRNKKRLKSTKRQKGRERERDEEKKTEKERFKKDKEEINLMYIYKPGMAGKIIWIYFFILWLNLTSLLLFVSHDLALACLFAA